MGIFSDILDGVEGAAGKGLETLGTVTDFAGSNLRHHVAGPIYYGSSILANKYIDPIVPDWLLDPVTDEELAAQRESWARDGGEGVWEDQATGKMGEVINRASLGLIPEPIGRGLVDIGLDPLTFAAGIGAGGKALRATADTSTVLGRGQSIMGGILDVAGTVGKTPDVAAEKLIGGGAGLVNRGARAAAFSPVGRQTILPVARSANRNLISPVVARGQDFGTKIAQGPVGTKLSDLRKLAPDDRKKQLNDLLNDDVSALTYKNEERRRYGQRQGEFALENMTPEQIALNAQRQNPQSYTDLVPTQNPEFRGSPDVIDLAQGNRDPKGVIVANSKEARQAHEYNLAQARASEGFKMFPGRDPNTVPAVAPSLLPKPAQVMPESTPAPFASTVRGDMADQVSEAVKGDFKGESFKITPGGLEPGYYPNGFPVSVRSAGDTGVLTTNLGENALRSEVRKFFRDIDPVLKGPGGDELFAGIYPVKDSPGDFTFDLNIPARTAEEAEEIGALTNQISFWNPDIDNEVFLDRGLKNSDSQFKTPEQISEFLDMVNTSRAEGRSLIDVAAERGYQVQGTPGKGQPMGLVPGPPKIKSADVPKGIARILPASQYVDSLYREVDLRDVGMYTTPGDGHWGTAGQNEVFFSNTPETALGQGRNSKGVLLEFSPDIKVSPNSSKPGWDFSWDQGNAEFYTKPNHAEYSRGGKIHDALRSATFRIDPKSPPIVRRDTKRMISELESKGWTKEEVGGAVKMTSPGAGQPMGITPGVSSSPGVPPTDLPPILPEEGVNPLADNAREFIKQRPDEGNFGWMKRVLIDTPISDQGAMGASIVGDKLANSRIGKALAPPPKPTEQSIRQAGSPEYMQGLDAPAGMPLAYTEGKGPKPWLSNEVNNRLYTTRLSNGESIGDMADRLYDELDYDKMVMDGYGIKWQDTLSDGTATPRTMKVGLTDNKDLKKIIDKWHKLGINPAKTLDENVQNALRHQIDEDTLPTGAKKRSGYDKTKTIWSEVALASGRYPVANFFGNAIDSMITGHWNFASPIDIFKYASRDLKNMSPEELFAGTKLSDLMTEWGDNPRSTLMGTGFRDNIGSGRKSQSRAALEKIGMGKLAKVVETPMALAVGADVMQKAAVTHDILSKGWEEGMPELLGKLDKIAMDAGFDTTGLKMVPSKDPAVIYDYWKKAGMKDGYAQRMSREVAELQNTLRKSADKEINRIFLDYRKTNADELVSKVIPFHYWASRKLRFYTEEAMRNPALLAGYLRATQGLQHAQEDGGLNARQKGFLALMGGPTGFMLLMNPDAMMGVIKASAMDQNYTPEGETEIGGVMRRLKKYGVGLYPWIDGIMNMSGMYGDTFEPDMLGIRHRAIVGSVVNWMRSEGMMGESNRNVGASPYADANLAAREGISNWISEFTPDWLTHPVDVKEGGSPGQISMEQTIQSRVMAENPGLNNEQLLAIMNDPDGDAYKSAFQDAARSGVLAQSLSFMLPASFRVDENTKDVRNAQREIISTEAEKLGIKPWEMTTTQADAEFKAHYKNATGNEFTNTDYDTAGFKNDLTRAAPGARSFVIWGSEYQNIVDQIAPGVESEYYAIMNGEKPPKGMNKMVFDQATPEQRQAYADQWLSASGNAPRLQAAKDLQNAYIAQHPQFATYVDWKRKMRDLQSALGGSLAEYRAEVARGNPYAADYIASQTQYLRGLGLRDAELATALDQTMLKPDAWYALSGQASTLQSKQSGDAGLGDPMPAMSAPYQQGGGYTNPMALMPEEGPMSDMLSGQQLQYTSGPGAFMSENTGQPPIDWAAEAQRWRVNH